MYAVTGRTAAELIVERADLAADNMALTDWDGDRVRKADVLVSKNDLDAREMDQLNRLVSMFLDFAEDRAARRIETRMADWIVQTDRFLDFNERSVLAGSGRVSREQVEAIAGARYATFDVHRRTVETMAAEREADADLRHCKPKPGNWPPLGNRPRGSFHRSQCDHAPAQFPHA